MLFFFSVREWFSGSSICSLDSDNNVHVFTVQGPYVLFNVTYRNRATFNQTSFSLVFTVYREAGYTGTFVVSFIPFDFTLTEMYNRNVTIAENVQNMKPVQSYSGCIFCTYPATVTASRIMYLLFGYIQPNVIFACLYCIHAYQTLECSTSG